MRAAAVLTERSPRLAGLLATPATRQLIRYAFAGLCVTQFAACVYSGAVFFLRMDPMLANVLSTACGLGHLLQGRDAAITTGVLGAFWAIVYLRRRSSIAPMVSHAGFHALEVLRVAIIASA